MKTLDRLNGRFPFGLDREIPGWNDHVPGGKHRRRRRYILVTLVPDTFVLHRVAGPIGHPSPSWP